MNDATSTEERYSKKVADCQVRVTKKLDGSEIFAELTQFFFLYRTVGILALQSICDWHNRAFEFFLYYVITELKLKYSEKATNVLEKYSNLFDVPIIYYSFNIAVLYQVCSVLLDKSKYTIEYNIWRL